MVWLSYLRRANLGFLVRISMLLLIWGIQTGRILNASDPQSTVCIVIGAPGESEYGEMFQEWRSQWLKTTEGLLPVWIGEAGANELDQGDQRQEDRDRLRRWIASVEGMDEPSTCWLVLIGHGTYDGKVAKFNLRGADVSSMELGQWLKGSKHRWMIAVCASSSGPFLASLAGPDRVVITATKSGSETNFSRFGGYFAQSLGDITSDLDHDERFQFWRRMSPQVERPSDIIRKRSCSLPSIRSLMTTGMARERAWISFVACDQSNDRRRASLMEN